MIRAAMGGQCVELFLDEWGKPICMQKDTIEFSDTYHDFGMATSLKSWLDAWDFGDNIKTAESTKRLMNIFIDYEYAEWNTSG